MQERGYRTIEDVLKGLPGVDVLNHVHPDSKNVVTIRGVTGNNKFVILQDGIRISSPTGETNLQISENYPLYMARQVEILSGPASALYGADAFTGVINIITESPTTEGTVRGSVAGGDFHTWQTRFFTSKRFSDSVALSIGGHHQQSDGAPLSRLYPTDFAGLPAGSAPYEPAFRSFSTFAQIELWENLTLGWNQSFIATSLADAELPGATTTYEGPPENPTSQLTAYAKYKFTLDELFTTRTLEAGRELFREGDHADAFYVIVRGRVEAFKGNGSSEKRLGVMEVGDALGEIARLMDSPRTATVRALTPATLLSLSREHFQNLLAVSRELRLALNEMVKSRLKADRVSESAQSFVVPKAVAVVATPAAFGHATPEQLCGVPILHQLPEELRREAASLFSSEDLTAGQIVFREGQPADAF